MALDPRSESSDAEAREQSEFLQAVRDQVTRINLAVRALHNLYAQIDRWKGAVPDEVAADLRDLRARLESFEYELVQPTPLTHQPMGAFPRLADQLIYLFAVAESADRRPTVRHARRSRRRSRRSTTC